MSFGDETEASRLTRRKRNWIGDVKFTTTSAR
jgi:hypothetical protein